MIPHREEVITIGLSADIQFTSTERWQNKDLPLTKLMNRNGNKLIMDNGKIKISKGISKVLVSANMVSENSNDTYALMVRKNSNYFALSYNTPPANASLLTTVVTDCLIDVTENDLIDIVAYFSNSGKSQTIKAFDGCATYLTVKVIK